MGGGVIDAIRRVVNGVVFEQPTAASTATRIGRQLEMTDDLNDWLSNATLDDIWEWLWSLLEP